MRITFIAVITLFCRMHGRAQDNFIVRQFNTENGLPSNGIKGVQWDESTGFLWLATEAGIVRFNGVDFISFTKENTPGIKSERMMFMLRNHKGDIYAAGQSKDVTVVRQNKIVAWNRPDKFTGNEYLLSLLSVSESFFEHKLNINRQGKFLTDGSTIASLSNTSCFILTAGTLYYFSEKMTSPQHVQLPMQRVSRLFKSGGSCFITDDASHIFLLDSTGKSSAVTAVGADGKSIDLNSKTGLFAWDNGMRAPILIGNGKASQLLWNDGKFVLKLIATGVPGDALIRVAQYSEKNRLLFIGTDSKGLIVMSPALVQPKKRNAASTGSRNSYYTQIELPGGSVLTNEGDIIGDHPPNHEQLPISGKFGFTISMTNDSLMWYPKFNDQLNGYCLYQYNYGTKKTTVFPKIKLDDHGPVIVTNGHIYVADKTHVGIVDGDSARYIYTYQSDNASDLIYDVKELNPGTLVMATCRGLMSLNTTSKKLDTLRLDSSCVRTIWKYQDYLFLGTYGSGFFIYRNGRSKPMPLDKSRYLRYCHCFIPDDKGYCWISTNRGLFKARISDLIYAYEHDDMPHVYYQYFGQNDGMDITEMNGGCIPCGLTLKNKTISFPTMDGLLWVNPETATPLMPEGNIFIDRFRVDNAIVPFEEGQRVELPSGTREIQIRLGFSAWCNKENVLMEYQLNNDGKWFPVDIQTTAPLIKLNSLASGSYTLQIRKLNGFGINNYSYKNVDFIIVSPWYRRWWFYLLCIAVLFGLIMLFFRIRTRQYKTYQLNLEKQVQEKTRELQHQNEILEKNNTIKTRLISIISHDIVTPLKFLTVAGQNLAEKKQMMPEDLQQETIQEMTDTSQQLHQLSTNILNWIKYQNENRQLAREILHVHDLVSQVFGILQTLARHKKLELVNNVDKELTLYQYPEPLRILIYNLVANAINFSEQGSITVSDITSRECVMISVKDNGVGMTPEQVRNIMSETFIVSSTNVDNRKGNGLGYLIIKDLVKMTGAGLRILSEKGKGTEVFIEFPVKQTR